MIQQATDPARDCPACPSCDMPMGTPIKESEQDRWDGPDDANLFCPACGTGWVAAAPELNKARAAWAAYEVEMAATTDNESRRDR